MSLICLSDFEAYARDHLPKATWDFIAAGADDSYTRDDNILAFKRIRLRPRMLCDVSVIDTSTTVQGMEIPFPVGIAPTGLHCLAWPDGELSTSRASDAMNTCYIASTYSTCSVEEIAAAAPKGLRWFQLYIYRNRKLSEQLGYDGPEDYGVPINTLDPSVSWKDIYWLRNLTRLPIILKGILTKEDAELAVEHGVQGIIVSNHGGRQLDGVPATIDALSEIVNAVQGRVEVYVDGGIRTGSDVLKALALGARCVFVGRPVLWGLSYQEFERSCKSCVMNFACRWPLQAAKISLQSARTWCSFPSFRILPNTKKTASREERATEERKH
ncbi:2-Hydroxyacid oxidase 2 isoform X3 [Microcaecilia unicolor]|uniref:Hydroxyacid oxidase 2 isoform X3 n=1 Tax=Microcaecilia unicolor TaxID=1415580 RepID=A0A6P7XWR8_9AMPH|nr:hydroxyacid oxidase 2 isoform X3 [Microcaecilia unicolor]